jgi:hypothetical protein
MPEVSSLGGTRGGLMVAGSHGGLRLEQPSETKGEEEKRQGESVTGFK